MRFLVLFLLLSGDAFAQGCPGTPSACPSGVLSSVVVGAQTNMGFGTINVINGYYASGIQGVTCNGAPTNNFSTVNGIITHC
jgi:hypothetical protein